MAKYWAVIEISRFFYFLWKSSFVSNDDLWSLRSFTSNTQKNAFHVKIISCNRVWKFGGEILRDSKDISIFWFLAKFEFGLPWWTQNFELFTPPTPPTHLKSGFRIKICIKIKSESLIEQYLAVLMIFLFCFFYTKFQFRLLSWAPTFAFFTADACQTCFHNWS